jgi:hypothetical protein
MQQLIYAWRISTAWRERVGRPPTSVVAGAEKERARGVDLAAVRKAVGEASTWIQQRWRWRGIEADAEEERVHDVDPSAVEAGAEKERVHCVDPTMVDWWGCGSDGGGGMEAVEEQARRWWAKRYRQC